MFNLAYKHSLTIVQAPFRLYTLPSRLGSLLFGRAHSTTVLHAQSHSHILPLFRACSLRSHSLSPACAHPYSLKLPHAASRSQSLCTLSDSLPLTHAHSIVIEDRGNSVTLTLIPFSIKLAPFRLFLLSLALFCLLLLAFAPIARTYSLFLVLTCSFTCTRSLFLIYTPSSRALFCSLYPALSRSRSLSFVCAVSISLVLDISCVQTQTATLAPVHAHACACVVDLSECNNR